MADKNLKLNIQIQADTSNTTDELNKVTEATEQVGVAAKKSESSFSSFGKTAIVAMVGLGSAIIGATRGIYSFLQSTIGLNVRLQTSNVLLKAAGALVGNLSREFTISLGFLRRFADYLRAINFPITPLTTFLDLMGRFNVVVGVGKNARAFDDTISDAERAKEAIEDIGNTAKVTADLTTRYLKLQVISFGAETLKAGLQVREAAGFEKSFANVTRLVEGSKQQVEALKTSLIGLGTSNISLPDDQINALAEAAAQAGIEIEKIPEFVETVAQASVAFGISAADTGQQLAQIKNILGESFPGLREYTDLINAAADGIAGVSERDLLNVLSSQVASAGNSFGLTAQQTIALSSAMLALEKQPEIAATALSNLLTTLQTAQSATPAAAEGFLQLGFTTQELAARIKADPIKTLDLFLERLNKLSKAERVEVVDKILGKGRDATALVKMSSSIDVFRNAVKLLGDDTKVAGSAFASFISQSNTLSDKMIILWNNIKELSRALVDPLLPAVKLAVDGITLFINVAARFFREFPLAAIFLKVASIAIPLRIMSNIILLLIKLVPILKAGFLLLISPLTALLTVITASTVKLEWLAIKLGIANVVQNTFFTSLLTNLGLTNTALLRLRVGFALVGGWVTILGTAIVALIAFKDELFGEKEKKKEILAEETAIVKKLDENIQKLRDEAAKTSQQLQESFENIKKRLNAVIDNNRENYRRDLDALDRAEQEKLRIIADSSDNRSEIERQSTDFLIQSYAEKIKLTQDYQEQTTRLINDVYDSEIAKAKGNTEIIDQLSKEAAELKKASLSETEKAYSDSIKKLIDLERDLRDKAKQYNEDAVNNRKAALDRIKALESKGLGDKVEAAAREKEILQVNNQLEISLKEQDYIKAAELSKKKVDLLTKEAEYRTSLINKQKAEQTRAEADLQELIDKRSAVQDAFLKEQGSENADREKLRLLSEEYIKLGDEIKRAGEERVKLAATADVQRTDEDVANENSKTAAIERANLAIEEQARISQNLALQKQQEADAVKAEADKQSADREALLSQLREIDLFLTAPKPLVVDTAESLQRVQDLKEAIDDAVKQRELVVTSLNAPAPTQAKNKGGFIESIKRFATGGRVPGVGNTDTVPALLTPGEFVINKQAAAKLGAGFLNSLNSGATPSKYAKGGGVGDTTTLVLDLGNNITLPATANKNAVKDFTEAYKRMKRVQK